MKRSSKILIAFAAAAITYLSLLQFAGPGHVGYSAFRAYGEHRQMNCERFHRGDQNKPSPDALRQEESFQPNPGNNNNY